MDSSRKKLLMPNGEEPTICPYDMSHIVAKSKFTTHLDRCKQNYLKERQRLGLPIELISCRFNSTHILPRAQMEYHEERCVDQVRLVSHMRYMQSDVALSIATTGEPVAMPLPLPVAGPLFREDPWAYADLGLAKVAVPWEIARKVLPPEDRYLSRAEQWRKYQAIKKERQEAAEAEKLREKNSMESQK